MLQITVPAGEMYDENTNMFINIKEQTLVLKHSLVSLYKWESKWHKPFIATKKKTDEETLDYIKCMTITQNVDPNVYLFLTKENLDQIDAYIDNPMTATTFPDNDKKGGKSRIVTAELIYYWMFSLQIPVSWEKKHLNQLITLIRVFNVENAPAEKRSQADILRSNRELNRARRAKLNSKG